VSAVCRRDGLFESHLKVKGEDGTRPDSVEHVECHTDAVASVIRTRDGQPGDAVVAVAEHLDSQTVVLLYRARHEITRRNS